jgi:hypothetical protein
MPRPEIDAVSDVQIDDQQRSIRVLAYGGGNRTGRQTDSRLYRLERGYPYQRMGRLVLAVNQFKGLSLYTPSTSNLPQLKTVSQPQKSVGQSPTSSSSTTPTRIHFPYKTNDLL